MTHGTTRDRPEDEPKTPLLPQGEEVGLTVEELAKKEIEETNVPHTRVLRLLSADCWAVLLGLLGSV
ncbi:hypothetical protein ACX0FC_17915, partial [Enterococcus faecium]